LIVSYDTFFRLMDLPHLMGNPTGCPQALGQASLAHNSTSLSSNKRRYISDRNERKGPRGLQERRRHHLTPTGAKSVKSHGYTLSYNSLFFSDLKPENSEFFTPSSFVCILGLCNISKADAPKKIFDGHRKQAS
jgi:hypothetical protein